MLLLVVVFSTTVLSEIIDQVFRLNTDTQSNCNPFYLDQLRNRKLNWLLAAPRYDELTIRSKLKVIRSLEIHINKYQIVK